MTVEALAAAILGLSTRTVETHKYEMMQALGVGSTAELVKYAIKHDLTACTDAESAAASSRTRPSPCSENVRSP